eukprot:1137833-Pelagomonas_calceolata.AAC.1
MGVSMVPVRAWTLDQVCHILVMKIMARPGRRASCAFWSWRSWQESCYGSGEKAAETALRDREIMQQYPCDAMFGQDLIAGHEDQCNIGARTERKTQH